MGCHSLHDIGSGTAKLLTTSVCPEGPKYWIQHAQVGEPGGFCAQGIPLCSQEQRKAMATEEPFMLAALNYNHRIIE